MANIFLFVLLAAPDGSAKSVFELDGNSVQLVVVWASSESLGGDEANVEFDVGE